MPQDTPTFLDEENSPIFQDIARFRGLIFDSILKPHDMTMSQGWVLVHLIRENGLNQAEIAKRMDVATVTTSKLIDRLEARGFVERRGDPDDRRSKRVYATDAARAVVKVMTKTVHEVDALANQGIDEDKLRDVREVLKAMRENLKAAAADRR